MSRKFLILICLIGMIGIITEVSCKKKKKESQRDKTRHKIVKEKVVVPWGTVPADYNNDYDDEILEEKSFRRFSFDDTLIKPDFELSTESGANQFKRSNNNNDDQLS